MSRTIQPHGTGQFGNGRVTDNYVNIEFDKEQQRQKHVDGLPASDNLSHSLPKYMREEGVDEGIQGTNVLHQFARYEDEFGFVPVTRRWEQIAKRTMILKDLSAGNSM